MALAFVGPTILVVFFVIHDFQHEQSPGLEEDSGDHSEAIVADIEDDAAPDLVGRSECPAHFPEIDP